MASLEEAAGTAYYKEKKLQINSLTNPLYSCDLVITAYLSASLIYNPERFHSIISLILYLVTPVFLLS